MNHDIIDNSSGIVKDLPMSSPLHAGDPQRLDLTGQVFGRLTATSRVSQPGISVWLCNCTCGNTKVVRAAHLKRGSTTSCGCLRKEKLSERKTTHGLTKHQLYKTWRGMVSRCNNLNSTNYSRYGGIGITVCPPWLKFENFYQDMGNTYREGLSIDRIDNKKGYCKDNCRWATPQEQNRNRGSNRSVVYRGETRIIIEWCELLKISYASTLKRLEAGWTVERAFELPKNARNPDLRKQ